MTAAETSSPPSMTAAMGSDSMSDSSVPGDANPPIRRPELVRWGNGGSFARGRSSLAGEGEKTPGNGAAVLRAERGVAAAGNGEAMRRRKALDVGFRMREAAARADPDVAVSRVLGREDEQPLRLQGRGHPGGGTRQ